VSGKWVVFTKDGAFAPLGNVWYNSLYEAINVCEQFDVHEFCVKHQNLVTDDEMKQIMKAQGVIV
jgi:hypothetical protein